jgi:cytochrome c-type biogenesis protein CcmH
MKPNKFLILALTLIVSTAGFAQQAPVQEPMVFESPQQEERFNQLTQELRCLVCQNQNLADSDATLAHDLRREVHEMLQTGQSNEQIKEFMVQRYGDFVLYRPPVQKNTYLLWLGPLILLLGGALILRTIVKKRSALFNNADGADGADTPSDTTQ